MVCELQFMSSISALLLNEKYAIAKLDGVAQLHKVNLAFASKDPCFTFCCLPRHSIRS